MTTKEMIYAEIERVDEAQLDTLYVLIKQFVQTKQSPQQLGSISKLKQIQIDGPEDFAANLDLYLSGEKRVE